MIAASQFITASFPLAMSMEAGEGGVDRGEEFFFAGAAAGWERHFKAACSDGAQPGLGLHPAFHGGAATSMHLPSVGQTWSRDARMLTTKRSALRVPATGDPDW
jgi:hypothetical protein